MVSIDPDPINVQVVEPAEDWHTIWLQAQQNRQRLARSMAHPLILTRKTLQHNIKQSVVSAVLGNSKNAGAAWSRSAGHRDYHRLEQRRDHHLTKRLA